MDTNERRTYQRSGSFNCDARVSMDGGRSWTEFDVQDLSSGGLQMNLKHELELGAEVLFDLNFYGLATQFQTQLPGVVKRKDPTQHYFIYGISFVRMSPDLKIRIDETINQMRPKDFLI